MKYSLIALGLAAMLASSCATVQQNVDARTYLAKCKYEYAGLTVTGVHFSSGIDVDTVDLRVLVKITDTTDKDVALDHAAFALFLDASHVLDVAHNRFVRIAPKAFSTEPVDVGLPFGGIVKSLGHKPQKIGIKAKLWVTILIGKSTWETPVVIPLEVEMPVPYDQIDKFVAQRKQELEKEAADKAANAAKSVLPSVQPPHF